MLDSADQLLGAEKAGGPPLPPPPAYTAQQPPVVYQQPVVLDNPPGDQFMMSLFTTFCCFMPLGIIALIKSAEVGTVELYFLLLEQAQIFICFVY